MISNKTGAVAEEVLVIRWLVFVMNKINSSAMDDEKELKFSFEIMCVKICLYEKPYN